MLAGLSTRLGSGFRSAALGIAASLVFGALLLTEAAAQTAPLSVSCASKTMLCKFGETVSIQRTGSAAVAIQNARLVLRWAPEQEVKLGAGQDLNWQIPLETKIDANQEIKVDLRWAEEDAARISAALRAYPKAVVALGLQLQGGDGKVVATSRLSLDLTPLYEARAWTLDVESASCHRTQAAQCTFDDELFLQVKYLRQWQDATKTADSALQLALDDRVVGVIAPETPRCSESARSTDCAAVLRLHRNSQDAINVAGWAPVIAGLRGERNSMSAAIAVGGSIAGAAAKFELHVPRSVGGFWWVLVLLGIAVLGWAGGMTDIVRDTTLSSRYPYLLQIEKALSDPRLRYVNPASLAKTQMLLWTVVGLFSWIYLWLVCGDINTLNATAFALMGISYATGVGAQLVDAKVDEAAERALVQWLDELEVLVAKDAANTALATKTNRGAIEQHWSNPPALLKDCRRNFWRNLIEGDNGKPTQLHRLQVIGFTVVLAAFFIAAVATTLAMPTFSDNVLAMLGISGGTYVGFKFSQTP
jgi:hypothetical protein